MNNYISKLNLVAAEYFTVAGIARHVCVTCGPRPVTSTGFYWTPNRIAVGAPGSTCPSGVTASYEIPATPASGNCSYVACYSQGGVIRAATANYPCSGNYLPFAKVPESTPVLQGPVESGGRPRQG
jgi:hypothetical protein